MDRNQPRLKLVRSPLVLVLAQARISPVLQMNEYVPKIQEVLRRRSFPKFKEDVGQQILFGPKPEFTTKKRWLFSARDQSKTVVIAPDFIVLQCSHYNFFADFVDLFGEVLETVGKEVEIDSSDRLGLRYVDLIRTKNGESISDYLQKGLLALPRESLKAEKLLYRFEMLAKTAPGNLLVRLMQTEDGTFLPPGIDQSDLHFDVQIEKGEIVTILDIDHHSLKEREFDPANLVQEMWQLHDFTDLAFRSAVTEKALSLWGAEERPESE